MSSAVKPEATQIPPSQTVSATGPASLKTLASQAVTALPLDNRARAFRNAAAHGQTELLEDLYTLTPPQERTELVQGTSSNGNTALHWSAARGRKACVKALLKLPETRTQVRNQNKKRPIECSKHADIKKALIPKPALNIGETDGNFWVEPIAHFGEAPFSFATLLEDLQDALPKPSEGPMRILSLGCGYGLDAYAYLAAFEPVEILGLDLDADKIQFAKMAFLGQANVDFKRRDCRALTLKKRFNLVVLRHPEFTIQPEVWLTILTKGLEMLAPRGAILITAYAEKELHGMLEWAQHIAPSTRIMAGQNMPERGQKSRMGLMEMDLHYALLKA